MNRSIFICAIALTFCVATSAHADRTAPQGATFAAPSEKIVQGKIVKLVPSKTEIYVLADGTKYEYYFNDETRVIEGGEVKKFSDLSEGLEVKVTAKKIGKRLDPTQVEIIP